MEYKVKFFKKPPKGMKLVENENGYTINISSINWEIFPLWVLMAGFSLAIIIAAIIYSYVLLVALSIVGYLTYLLTTVVFMNAKLVIHKTEFKLYTSFNILLNITSYEIDLNEIHTIRCVTGAGRSGGINGSANWKNPGYNHIDFIGYNKKSNDSVALYKKEYNVFISQFLNDYKKILDNANKVSI